VLLGCSDFADAFVVPTMRMVVWSFDQEGVWSNSNHHSNVWKRVPPFFDAEGDTVAIRNELVLTVSGG
jgi:hypothetical protein